MKPGVFDGFTEDLQKEKARTIKACPAIVEYMNEGFVIPAWTDMHFLHTNGELHVRHAMKNHLQGIDAAFGTHSKEQIGEAPMANIPGGGAIKINNVWFMRTPKNYSIRITEMFYDFHKGIRILPGVVRSDFAPMVNFPIEVDIVPDEVVKIAAGTPLIHVVPFNRNDVLDLEVRQATKKDYDYVQSYRQRLTSHFQNGYRTIAKQEEE